MRAWLLALLGVVWLMPSFVRAERAVVLPLRSEVELTPQQRASVTTAQAQALRQQGVELVEVAEIEPCTGQACVDARIMEGGAEHAVELVLWRSEVGSISGVSVSVLTRSGLRFSEGATLETDDDLAAAVSRATQGAYARLSRGPGPWLELTGTPEGANIAIDGDAAGVVPGRVKVRGGLHRVRVSFDGFDTFETTVTVPRNADALKQVSVALKVSIGTSATSDRAEDGSRSRVWSYALAGVAVAASAVLAVGPLRSAVEDGECGRVEEGTCTGVVAFDGVQGLQLGAAALLLAAGVTVAVWGPL